MKSPQDVERHTYTHSQHTQECVMGNYPVNLTSARLNSEVGLCLKSLLRLPWWLRCKESTCNAGDLGSIPGSRRSPGEENGYLLQYFGLKNPMDREALRATSPWDHKKSDTTEQLTLFHFMLEICLTLEAYSSRYTCIMRITAQTEHTGPKFPSAQLAHPVVFLTCSQN